MSAEPFALGVDVGGSSVKAVAVTAAGRLLARRNQPFDPERHRHFAETVRTVIEDLEQELGGHAICIGLSAPGLAANDGESIAYLPGRLPGLEGLSWRDHLRRAHPVPVLNDAHAALLGEVWLGAAQGLANVILLTLGTGVGGAAMVDGRLLRGHSGKAGHLGHLSLDVDGPPDICGTPGSLELAIGNCTIHGRTGGRFATTHDLIRAHEAGDAFASQIWLASVKALAAAVVSLTNILDPEAVVLGGGIAAAGGTLFAPLRRMVGEREWKVCGHEVRLVPAELGELAGACGAAWNALGGR